MKSENEKLRVIAARLDTASRKLASIEKGSTAGERAELLASVPDMPSDMKRVLATAAIDVVRQAVADHLAHGESSEQAGRSKERAEIARRMGITAAAPKRASVKTGRTQTFPTLTADAAKQIIRAGR